MACGFFISAGETDQTWHMPRHIRVLAGPTCHCSFCHEAAPII